MRYEVWCSREKEPRLPEEEHANWENEAIDSWRAAEQAIAERFPSVRGSDSDQRPHLFYCHTLCETGEHKRLVVQVERVTIRRTVGNW